MESLEDRSLLATLQLNPIADGLVADRNLDGAFETAVVSGSSISNRWFTDPAIGQERGVFEYDLSQIPAGTQILSARFRVNVNSYTTSVFGPQFIVSGYIGDGLVTPADGTIAASFLGSGSISGLGSQEVQLQASLIAGYIGKTAGIRVSNTALSAHWFSVSSLENSFSTPAQLILETASNQIKVSPVSGLTTTEQGGTASFTVVLGSMPTSNVSIGLSTSDTSEGTISIDSLTFDSTNWNIPQTVVVTGVDDVELDGNILYNIVTYPAVSLDPLFNNIDASDVSVTNLDHGWTQLTLNAGDLLINDLASFGKNDSLTIQSDVVNNKFIISDPTPGHNIHAAGVPGAVVSSDKRSVDIPFSSVSGTAIIFNSQDGNDSLNLDFALGNFSKSIVYNGGTQTIGDTLSLLNGPLGSITHNLSSENLGTISIASNSLITYTGLESVSDRLIAADRIFTYTGGAETITLSDATGANMIIDSTLGTAVTFANPTSSLVINSGSGNDSVTVASVDTNGPYNASLTINGDAGSDSIALIPDIVFAPGNKLDVDLQNDAAVGDADRFLLSFNANIATSGTGTITIAASRDISLANGSSLEVVDGNLVLAANQQATRTTGFFQGVNLTAALLRTTGTGNISVLGQGGNDSSTSTHIGVYMQSGAAVESTSNAVGAGTITLNGTGGSGTLVNYGVRIVNNGTRVTSSVGNIQITGTGGTGSGDFNGGILVDLGAAIRSTGIGPNAANITLTGTGARGNNLGVGVHIDSSSITTVDGDIQLNGNGGFGIGQYNIGIDIFGSSGLVESTGTGASVGTITFNGVGGLGSNLNTGIFIDGGSRVKSADGAIQLSGTGLDTSGTGNDGIHIETGGSVQTTGLATASIVGASATASSFGIALLNPSTLTLNGATNSLVADRMSIDVVGATINAPGKAVSLRPKTNGIAINLGAVDSNSSLGLSNAELNRIQAETIQIGDNNSGPITVSDIIAHSTFSNFDLKSSSDILFAPGSISTGGGSLRLTPGASSSVQPITSGQEMQASVVSFNANTILSIPINGTTVDTQYRQLHASAIVDLTGVNLILSGTYVPSASDRFLIVNNASNAQIVGTFNGLPEGATVNVNGTNKIISYVGGDGNDAVLSSPTLTISIANSSILETDGTSATTATVTRIHSDTSNALTVTLANDDTTEIIVPTVLVIPAGQASVSFDIHAVDDMIADGTQIATLTVSAFGFLSGTGSIEVLDAPTLSDIPDQTTLEDTPTASIAFTAGDGPDLVLSGDSSNSILVPASNIVFSGSGTNRTLIITPAPNQFGTATITVTINDNGKTISDTFVLTVTAVNDPPVANAGGPYSIGEGSTLELNGSNSFDFDQSNTELSYAWDLNYDGVSFDVDMTGMSPSVLYPDDFASRSIAVRVTDSAGLQSIATTTLIVNNLAPSASVSGATNGVSGQVRSFTLGAMDPSPTDQASTFTFNINWGDNLTQTVTGTAGITVNHIYAATGTYDVRITATDKDGAVSSLSTALSVVIVTAEIQGNDLMIGGTTGNDALTLTAGSSAGSFSVKIGTTNLGSFTLGTSGLIQIFGQAGNDSLTVNGTSNADSFRAINSTSMAINGISVISQDLESWQLNGLGGTDSLVGADVSNTWLITAFGGGLLNSTIQFNSMENIAGGAANDIFKVNRGGELIGSINGSGGTNVLDYSSWTSEVAVNLRFSSATALGSVSNISVVVGGSGNDTLVAGALGSVLLGGAGSDSLQGGNGRDVLIGGSHSDRLRGGAGEDILFGGTTSYFSESTKSLDLASLDAIFKQWSRTDMSYTNRINSLTVGSSPLISSSKFTTDANSADDLYGEGGQDWYLIDRKDRLRDNLANETVSLLRG